MPTVTSGPEIHPLCTYEPRSPHAGALAVPQQRPAGQLSLALWAVPPSLTEPANAATEFDETKVRAVLTALVEAYSGLRSINQVRRALAPKVYQELGSRGRASGQHYTLKKAHASQPANGIIEACGVVRNGDRVLAMCAQFQEGSHGWLCTEFTILEPR